MTTTEIRSTITGKLYGFQVRDDAGRFAHQDTVGGPFGWTTVQDLGNVFPTQAAAQAAIDCGQIR